MIVDPTLNYAGLQNLGSKLKPAPGWKYRVKVLDQDLTIKAVNGKARIATQPEKAMNDFSESPKRPNRGVGPGFHGVGVGWR